MLHSVEPRPMGKGKVRASRCAPTSALLPSNRIVLGYSRTPCGVKAACSHAQRCTDHEPCQVPIISCRIATHTRVKHINTTVHITCAHLQSACHTTKISALALQPPERE